LPDDVVQASTGEHNFSMTPRTGLVVLSLLLSVLIGLTLDARGRPGAQPAARERPRIGLSLGTLQEERWQRDRERFVARAEQLGAEVLVQSGNSDAARQLQDIESLLSRGVDVLVIVAHDPTAMGRAVEGARHAGVPVICYDRLITGCDVDLYLSFDNVRVGRMQAEYLVRRLGGKGRIVRVYGPKTDQTGLLFKQGQDEVLAPLIARGDVVVVHEDYAAGWKPAEAKRIVSAAITARGKAFDAVLATNDGTAGGAIQALIEEGLAGKILVTGQDADLAACQRIVRGTQTMSVYKPLAKLAEHAAEVAVTLARRKPVIARDGVANGVKEVPSILEPVVAVDRENLEATVIQDGFHRAEDLR
jgi:D-xylose transport system substrate-binding protein